MIPIDSGALINRVIELEEQLKEAKQHNYKMQVDCLLEENEFERKQNGLLKDSNKRLAKQIQKSICSSCCHLSSLTDSLEYQVEDLENQSAEDQKTITELKHKLELSQCSYNLLLDSEIIKREAM